MPRADFYILTGPASPARLACTIANKAWQQGRRVHISTASREEAVKMDDLLWTFHDISFLPHALADETGAEQACITIGWPDSTLPDRDVLINLTAQAPDLEGKFARIIEIVAPEAKQQARERYRQYRDRGFELHNHDISAETSNA